MKQHYELSFTMYELDISYPLPYCMVWTPNTKWSVWVVLYDKMQGIVKKEWDKT